MMLFVLICFLVFFHWTYAKRIERLEDTERLVRTRPWEREDK